jgi:hypothetical protein
MGFFLSEWIGAAMWGGARSFYQGARGTIKQTDEAGNVVSRLRPRERLAQSLRESHAKRMEAAKERGGLGIGAALTSGIEHAVSWPALAVGNTMHWIARGGWEATKATTQTFAKPTWQMMHDVGWSVADGVTDMSLNAAEKVARMAQHPAGATALFLAPALGGLAAPLYDNEVNYALNKGLQQYAGQPIETLPGVVTPTDKVGPTLEQAKHYGHAHLLLKESPLDNFGANGELVFAMHNMR